MNILFLATFSFSDAGGVGRVSQTLAEEFSQRGHGCFFLSTSPKNGDAAERSEQMHLPSYPIASRVNIRALRQLIQNLEINAIINQAGANTEVLDLAAAVVDDCSLFTVHHNCVSCLQDNHESIVEHSFDRLGVPQFFRWPIVYRFLKERSRKKTGKAFERAARESSALILLAESFIDELAVFSKRIDYQNVVAIPNPAPFAPDPSALSEKENVLLYVGRLANGQKRVDRVLKIWEAISRSRSSWRLDIVGDGPDREMLQAMASKMGLERIRFHGQTDPAPFYRRAKVLLMTSDFEGFGMVLVEAQAFGCVPVAFECFSAIREIVQNKDTGLLIRRGDVDEYIRAIDAAMGANDQLERMSRLAVEASSKFSAESIVDRWLNVFAGPK